MPGEDSKYKLVIARCFLKDMKKLSREDRLRTRRALPKLQAAPYQGQKVSAAETGQYRWRVGNLRIRYDLEENVIYLSIAGYQAGRYVPLILAEPGHAK